MPALPCQPQTTPATVQPTEPHQRHAANTTANGFRSTHLRPLAGLLAALCLAVASPVQAQLQETTNRIGITMVSIPAGSFAMGSCKTITLTSAQEEENKKRAFLGQPLLRAAQNECLAGRPDPEASDREAPQHTVRVPAFQLGKTEVTLGQFKQFIAAAGRTDLVNDAFMKYNRFGDNVPVTLVSWHDAQAFIAWLNQTEGKGWRLPSEAEWEYACRAGGNHTYCGSNDVDSVAWYEDNSGERPRAVATKQPNAWGLHDMSGNSWEWVQDSLHDSYRGAPTDGSAWTSGGRQDARVLRGGSWLYAARDTRAANRYSHPPEVRDSYGGFRVARTAP